MVSVNSLTGSLPSFAHLEIVDNNSDPSSQQSEESRTHVSQRIDEEVGITDEDLLQMAPVRAGFAYSARNVFQGRSGPVVSSAVMKKKESSSSLTADIRDPDIGQINDSHRRSPSRKKTTSDILDFKAQILEVSEEAASVSTYKDNQVIKNRSADPLGDYQMLTEESDKGDENDLRPSIPNEFIQMNPSQEQSSTSFTLM